MSTSKEIRFPVTDFTAYTYTVRNDSLWICACSAKEEIKKIMGALIVKDSFDYSIGAVRVVVIFVVRPMIY